jgi:hypothetical protein
LSPAKTENGLEDSVVILNPEYEGWLYIRLSQNNPWKKRYCILKDGTLYVFKALSVSSFFTKFF